MKAFLLAAGLGTRLKPFTDKHPKALLSINGKTLLQRNIEYVKNVGVREIIINIHHFGEQIVSYLKAHNDFGCHITISNEKDKLLETGGALLKAKEYLQNDSFVLINTDILTHLDLAAMIQYHEKHKPLVTLAVSERESSRQLEFDAQFNLCGWQNLTTGEHIYNTQQALYKRAFSGIHVVDSQVFKFIIETGKFSIMQPYLRLMHDYKLKGYDHTGIPVLDVGKPENIPIAEKWFS
jgi:NDP-sugar pyrophosphorylase family protein